MENESVIGKRVYDFSKGVDIVQTILIYLVALLVPTFLGQILKAVFPAESFVVTKAQLIVGSIVNTALIVAGMNFKGWAKVLGVITMPSISTIVSGHIFAGPTSVYMAYMIPAIWIGNFALVYAIKLIKVSKEKNYFLAAIVGIVIKVAVIFGGFSLLQLIINIPEKMAINLSTAMSTTQLITASIGAIIAFGIYKLEVKNK